jgi:endonuclease/exonuclease/phosphatase family metal-dependent hydrolase
VRLDYVFVPTAFKSRIRECEVFTHPAAAAASDHLPLFAEIAT